MKTKRNIKPAVYFGVLVTVFMVLQDLLAHDNQTKKSVIISVVSGIIGGALAGLVFGWLLPRFTNSKLLKQSTETETEPDESILFETGASHFKGAEAVGGRLYLTTKRLVFKSHHFNIQNHELSISLTAIDEVGRHKTMGVVNNGIHVYSRGNSIEKFAVEQPDKWLTELTATIASQKEKV